MHAVVTLLAATLMGHGLHAGAPPVDTPDAVTPDRVRVAIIGLRNDGVDAAIVSQVVDALALSISRHSETEVLTSTDIEAVLGLEATRQALDCDEGSCAAMDEITRALDVRYTIGGSIAPRRDGFYVYASLVDVAGGRAVARSGALVNDDDYAVDLAPLVDELLIGLHGKGAASSATVPDVSAASELGAAGERSADGGLPLVSWAGIGVMGLAAVVMGTGAVLWAVDDGTIRDETSPFALKKEARERYVMDQAVLAVGAAAGVFGAAMVVAGLATGE